MLRQFLEFARRSGANQLTVSAEPAGAGTFCVSVDMIKNGKKSGVRVTESAIINTKHDVLLDHEVLDVLCRDLSTR